MNHSCCFVLPTHTSTFKRSSLGSPNDHACLSSCKYMDFVATATADSLLASVSIARLATFTSPTVGPLTTLPRSLCNPGASLNSIPRGSVSLWSITSLIMPDVASAISGQTFPFLCNISHPFLLPFSRRFFSRSSTASCLTTIGSTWPSSFTLSTSSFLPTLGFLLLLLSFLKLQWTSSLMWFMLILHGSSFQCHRGKPFAGAFVVCIHFHLISTWLLY